METSDRFRLLIIALVIIGLVLLAVKLPRRVFYFALFVVGIVYAILWLKKEIEQAHE